MGIQQRLRACTLALAALPLLVGTTSSAQGLSLPRPCPSQLAQYVSVATQDSAMPGQEPQSKVKSEKAAFQNSVLATLIPTATLVLAYPGLLIGPSTGYFYADQPGRAWKGIGIRTLATGGMISSFFICGWDCDGGDPEYGIAWMVFLGSAGTFVGSAIYDIATVKGAVRRQNAEILKLSWSISPHYAAGNDEIGLKLRLVF